MDWHLLGLTFITVFISELGDKSQLAAIAISSGSKSPRPVFFGAAAALLLASFLSVIIGQGTAHFLPARLVKIAAAVGFAILAVRLLVPDKIVKEQTSSEDGATSDPLNPSL